MNEHVERRSEGFHSRRECDRISITSCPSCGTSFKFRSNFSDQLARCKRCGHQFRLIHNVSAETRSSPTTPSANPRHGRPRNSKRLVPIAIAIAGVLLIAGTVHLYKAQDQASAPFLGSDNSRGANQDTLRGEILAVKQDRIGIVGLPGQVVLVHVRIENLTDRFIAATGNVIVSYAPRDGDQCHFRDLRALRFELMGHEAGEYHFAVIVPVGVDEFDRTDYLNDIDAYTNKPPPQPAQDLEEVADVTLYVEDGSPPARTLHRAPPGNWPRYEYPDVESAILGGRSQFLDRFSVTKLDLVQAAIASVRQITRDELRTVSEFAEGEKYIYDVALIYPSIASGPVSFTVMIEHHYRRPQGMTFGEKAFGIKPDAELYEVDSAAVTLEPGAIKHLMLLVDKHVGAKNVDVALYLGQYCGYEGEAGEYRDPTMRCVYKGRLKK